MSGGQKRACYHEAVCLPCFSTCCRIVGGATLQSASVAPGLDSQRAYQLGALAAAATEARPALQAKRGAAGPAGAAMGMPPLPAAEQQKTSPGAAARAARQRKRKSTAMVEELDERTMRMHKRMVRLPRSAFVFSWSSTQEGQCGKSGF